LAIKIFLNIVTPFFLSSSGALENNIKSPLILLFQRGIYIPLFKVYLNPSLAKRGKGRFY
jgi:hypothetical protein